MKDSDMRKYIVALAGTVVGVAIAATLVFGGGGQEVPPEPVALEGKWAAILAATPTPSPTPTPAAVTTPTPKSTDTPEPTVILAWTPTPTPEPVVTAAEERITTPVPASIPRSTLCADDEERLVDGTCQVVYPSEELPPKVTPTPTPRRDDSLYPPPPTVTPIPTPSPVPTPLSAIHVGDLDTWGPFNISAYGGWVRIVVHDAQHNPVMYAYVHADFFLDGVFYSSAYTALGGYSRDGIVMYWHNDRRTTAHSFPPGVLTYRVTDLRTSARDYDPTQNHDPDSDVGGIINVISDGTIIEIAQE